MAPTLAEIRAKLAEQETKKTGGAQRDNAVFAQWNIPEGSTARIRFLPDGDPNNTFFWVERNMIKLTFPGVKGQIGSKPFTVQVPCMEMWKEACPILAEVRPWFKDKNLEELGRKYWKKRSFIFQGFVRDNPMVEDATPENPIRRFIITQSLYPIVTNVLKDPEVEEIPTDTNRGLDFYIKKTTKGQFADYSTSAWARKESALTAVELAAIDQYGLFDLKQFLPNKPTAADLILIKEMFEASVDNAPFDTDRWGSIYMPRDAGNSGGADGEVRAPRPVTPAPAPVAAPTPAPAAMVEDDEDEVVATPTAAKANPRADEILAMIRARKTGG